MSAAINPNHCADCGTALGELCRDRIGALLCLRCYLRRPEPGAVVIPFHGYTRALRRQEQIG
jgi:hypothetical protein